MATHSSVLAWRIPGTGEPGGLPSVWSHRVGHDWGDLAAAAAAVMFTMCLRNCRIGSSQNDDSIKRAGPIIILCKVCMIFHQVSRIQGFPGGSVVKTLPVNSGDSSLTSGLRGSPEEGKGYLLQYSCLRNPMDGRAWQAPVHRVAEKSYRTQWLKNSIKSLSWLIDCIW